MIRANQLSCTVARHVADMPRGTVFAASYCAIAGVRLAQELMGCEASLCGRGGAYDLSGILSLHARHWLFNRSPHAYIGLLEVFDTLSEPHALLATPGQIDGAGNANLSVIGNHDRPRVAFGGTRGLPDGRTVHFVMPSHNARQLVERVDFVSTSVAGREQPALLITELGAMRWDAGSGGWRLEALAPGVEVDAVRNRTGFRFEVAPEPVRLDEPGPDLVAALERVDPLGLRRLDFVLDRTAQLDLIAEIYAREVERVGRQIVPARRAG
jgi:glutaconate CoA-transferase subunit B